MPRWAQEEEIEILAEKTKVSNAGIHNFFKNAEIHALSFIHTWASSGRHREGGFRFGSETISRVGDLILVHFLLF